MTIRRSWLAAAVLLCWLVTIDATVGQVFAEQAIGVDYQWGELGLTGQLGPIQGRLGYSTTANAERFGSVARSRWLASLSWFPGR